MRIGFVNTEIDKGGAARAMQRTISSLIAMGHDVILYTLSNDGISNGRVVRVVENNRTSTRKRNHRYHRFANDFYVAKNRHGNSNTLFWIPEVGFDLHQLMKSHQVDVVNIHWSSYFLNIKSIEEILSIPAPTVFTLHDMAHFTGGCHYSAECRNFEIQCKSCNQLKFDALRIPARVFEARERAYRNTMPWAISPSNWLKEEAIKSGLFKENRTRYISNAIDLKIFSPRDKVNSRREFSIPLNARVIMFGAFDNREHRKGFDLLMDAMHELAKDPLVKDGRPLVVFGFGNHLPEIHIKGVTTIAAGYIDEDEKLARAYSACDLVVLPSRQDNQPNVMVEAMACGTPLAGFAIGGMLDLIEDGTNGALAKPFSGAALASAMARILKDRDGENKMGELARRKIALVADPIVHSKAYLEVFRSAIKMRAESGNVWASHSKPVLRSGDIAIESKATTSDLIGKAGRFLSNLI
jgi:glycosyltransferase involved in cell wall biosynthesis